MVFFSKNNLPEIKDGAFVIKFDKYTSIGMHWIALYVNGDNTTHFDNFEVEYIPKEIKKLIVNKNITTNICRKQACNSIMCKYCCIAFIDFVFKDRSLLDYTNSFSPNEYEKNNKIILKYF